MMQMCCTCMNILKEVISNRILELHLDILDIPNTLCPERDKKDDRE